jgi:cold shock CspA family protein/ribosome-associated translation inhibitor RaiA
MEVPPEIAFRHVSPTEAMHQKLSDEIAHLDALEDGLISCRVMVELPQHRHKTGDLYAVRIDMNVRGQELVVSRTPPEHRAHEDPVQAIGDAFDRARRVLDDAKKQRQGRVKHHELPILGRVVRLFRDEGYGFLDSGSGQEIYFHENAVLDGDFAGLEVGSQVRFVEEQGDEGPQASMVKIEGDASHR